MQAQTNFSLIGENPHVLIYKKSVDWHENIYTLMPLKITNSEKGINKK